MPESALNLIPASRYSLEALTGLFNATRADYLIAMQLNPAGLADYMHIYDVNLAHSWVAQAGSQVLGLAMLGVRPGCTWITRLGVLPEGRRGGTGGALLRGLLDSTRALGCPLAILEVIQGNDPARALFLKAGFSPTRTLLILRRPAGPPDVAPAGVPAWLDAAQALDLLAGYPDHLPWTNAPQTYRNGADAGAGALGLSVDLGERGRGWLVFRRQPGELSHAVLHTQAGDPLVVGEALLAHLYARFPNLPSSFENVPAADPHLAALLRAGCAEAFRRTEMYWRDL